MSETKHRLRPWHVETEPMNVWTADGLLVCRVYGRFEEDLRAISEFICRACNCCEDLLAACEATEAELSIAQSREDPCSKSYLRIGLIRQELQAAIAKAKPTSSSP